MQEALQLRLASALRQGIAFYRLAGNYVAEATLEVYGKRVVGGIISARDNTLAISRWEDELPGTSNFDVFAEFLPEPAGGFFPDTQNVITRVSSLNKTETKALICQLEAWEKICRLNYPFRIECAKILP